MATAVWLGLLCFLPTHSFAQPCFSPGLNTVAIHGELRQWHRVTLDFHGPYATETCVPNPFFDYRLNVLFTHVSSGRQYLVPGFFAADGQAEETSANSGNVWRCHFSPDATGSWTWVASFRKGPGVAVNSGSLAGQATDFNGITGSFAVAANNKTVPDLRAKGRLEYVGERYLKFAGNGEYFLKAGADSPENFLAYDDFDNTPNAGNRRKSWGPHLQDWQTGDPVWQTTKGKGIIGAINYLASEGMNVFSFLVMNINGDDDNVFPFIVYNDQTSPQDDRMRYDVSKLAQWEIVFSHGESKGMYLHMKLCETENDQLLNGGYLGDERKLFFRELIARFGHHLALNWNMGEENDLWTELNDPNNLVLKSWMEYFHQNDPYNHHVVAHSYPWQHDQMYNPLVGLDSALTGVSLQTGWNQVHAHTRDWVEASEATLIKWVVCNDEQGSAYQGVPLTPGYPGFNPPANAPDFADIRSNTLWGNLMAGGGGVEYYFGYSFPESDLTCQDFRSRDGLWDDARIALDFFHTYLPFWDMIPDDNLVTHGYCLKQAPDLYVWHRGNITQQSSIQLPAGNTYQVYFFNPRTGGSLLSGPTINGGGSSGAPAPPSEVGQDWVILYINNQTAFPLQLLDLQASWVENRDVRLTWTGEQGLEGERMILERKTLNTPFEAIGEITVEADFQEARPFEWMDRGPAGNRFSYRIRAIGLDGEEYSSSQVEISRPDNGWSIFPNPATNQLQVLLPSGLEDVTIEMLDIMGRSVLLESLKGTHSGLHTISLNQLPPGSYLLVAKTSSGVWTERVEVAGN